MTRRVMQEPTRLPRAEIIVPATVAWTAAVFSLDVSLELGVAVAVPYIGAIWIVWYLQRAWAVWATAIGCSLLTVAGALISPDGGELWKVAANRGLALFAIWGTAALSVRLRDATRMSNDLRDSDPSTTLPDFLNAESSQRDSDRRLGMTLWTIIGVSLLVHVACLIAGSTILADWRWSHHPVHAAVEMAGSLTALWVARMLMSLDRRGAGTSFNVWIAGALVGMGLLDGLHALVHAGHEFVWLHSTATFVGGVLFATVWLPNEVQKRVAGWWPWAVGCAVLSFGVLSLAVPDLTPRMLVVNESGEKVFTGWAQGLNVIGGVMLFAATIRLILTWRQTKNVDDLLFCLHCALFGAAAVMFEQSQLWDLPWWGWHGLRLLAFGVALWFVVLSDLREAASFRRRAIEVSQLSAIVESSEDSILSSTLDGIVVSWNPGAERLHGYTASEMIGRSLSRGVPDDHQQQLTDMLSRVGAGEHVRSHETVRVRKDGERVDVSLTISPVYDAQEKLAGVSIIAHDITERKKLEQAQRELNETLERRVAERTSELKRSNADLEQFAYVASHDLQEPLRAVVGYSQLLEDELRDDEGDTTDFLQHIVDGGVRMQNLIHGLLDYSRVNRKGAGFELVDLNDPLNVALANLSEAIRESDAQINCGAMPTITGDPRQLAQLFQNIIGNGIKYRSNREPQIDVNSENTADGWQITITDNGIGIDPKYRERIFVIFQRLHTRDEYPGTGIGLAMCQRIVERHGGSIEMEPAPGGGSTFRIIFPEQPLSSDATAVL